MGSRFGDLTQYLDDTLTLPIRGVEYVIPGPPAEVGLMCQELFIAGVAFNAGMDVEEGSATATRKIILEGDEEINFYSRVLSKSVYDQMMRDGVSFPMIKRAATTAFLWIAQSEELALGFWTTGEMAPPKASAPTANRADRRSTRTRTASVPRQASPNGTKSRATSSKSSPKKATRSPGSRSSRAGD